jgi:hypothetical protein
LSGVIEKIQKRRFYPVPMSDGTTRHVMSLTGWHKVAMQDLKSPDAQLAFALGCCLVCENGERRFDREPDESPAAFALRLQDETTDLSFADISELVAAINKVTKTPNSEIIAKNSEPTDAPAS